MSNNNPNSHRIIPLRSGTFKDKRRRSDPKMERSLEMYRTTRGCGICKNSALYCYGQEVSKCDCKRSMVSYSMKLRNL